MEKQKKKVNSIVWQVVFFPLGVVMLILIIAVFLCFFSIQVLSNREVESNVNALQISLNQLDNELNRIDEAFIEYWNKNKSYAYLSQISDRNRIDLFLEYQLETINWMNNQVSLCSDVQGTFVYYENLELLLFRGGTNAKMHDYIKSRLDGSGIYNHWEFVTVDKAQYLINIKKYDSFYGGVWLPVTQLSQQLMVGGKLPGNVYMMDWKNENTSDQPSVHEALKNLDLKSDGSMEKIQVENRIYYNYTVKTPSENVVFGVMIPKGFFFDRIPPTVKAILILLLLCMVLVPMLIVWLRRKIARPIQVIDRAMKAVGEGDSGSIWRTIS